MFEIGKRVICIKGFLDPFSGNRVKLGQEFLLLGIKKASCGCHDIDLDVGLKAQKNWDMFCEFCGCGYPHPLDEIQWVSSIYFAPINDLELSDISLEDLLEEIGITEYAEC